MKRLLLIVSLLALVAPNVVMQNKIDCKNFVPDEVTAIKIAEAIWLPIYGKAIYQKKPFVAKLLDDNVWQVTGTLKTKKGGVPFIEIQKCDGKVLKVTHSK
jgi:hypothetical protein